MSFTRITGGRFMKATFGMYLDGVSWSDEPASLGEVRLGPAGMLGLLESRLGLSAPPVRQARRIDENMKRMELCDSDDAWFHRSFSTDPWSTAKQMLEWRDELVESGWNGEPMDSLLPRLRALSEIERADLSLSRGEADRLRDVANALSEKREHCMADITVILNSRKINYHRVRIIGNSRLTILYGG
jgi:hypothetical protein